MSELLTLVIPADPRFRALGPDVAGRYAELLGGARAAVSAAVAEVVDAIAQGGGANGAEIQITFRPSPGAVEVDVRSGTSTRTITCPL